MEEWLMVGLQLEVSTIEILMVLFNTKNDSQGLFV